MQRIVTVFAMLVLSASSASIIDSDRIRQLKQAASAKHATIDAVYAYHTLSLLDGKVAEELSSDQICGSLTHIGNGLINSLDVEAVYLTKALHRSRGCKSSLSSNIIQVLDLNEAVTKADMRHVFFALLDKTQVMPADLVAGNPLNAMTDDIKAKLRPILTSKSPSSWSLERLTFAYLVGCVSGFDSSVVEDLQKQLYSQIELVDNNRLLVGSDNRLTVDLIGLQSRSCRQFTVNQYVMWARSLVLISSHSALLNDWPELYRLVVAMSVVHDQQPDLIKLGSTTPDPDQRIHFSVVDLLDRPVTYSDKAAIEINSLDKWESVDDAYSPVDGRTPAMVTGNSFAIASDLDPGRYRIRLTASVLEPSTAKQAAGGKKKKKDKKVELDPPTKRGLTIIDGSEVEFGVSAGPLKVDQVSIRIDDESAVQTIRFANTLDRLVVGSEDGAVVKVKLEFAVKDKAGSVKPQQMFAILTDASGDQRRMVIHNIVPPVATNSLVTTEISLVSGQADSSKKKVSTFPLEPGTYSLWLVIADTLHDKPIQWKLVDALAFGSIDSTERPVALDSPLPEILHQFREPDARPSKTMSTVFTGIVCVVPVLFLVATWIAVRAVRAASIKSLCGSPFSLGFHTALALTFYLYFKFWLDTNMFTTMKYVATVSCATVVFGKRMLGTLATRYVSLEQKTK